VWQLAGKPIYSPINTLLCAFLIWCILTCAGSLNAVPLGRYAFLPGACFLLLLLVNVELSKSRVISIICMIVLSYSLATGVVHYPRLALTAPGEPSWSSEVAMWRRDPSHSLRIWPSWWSATIPGNLIHAR
jgi:hypothetical protein